jgi:hypothetical protein|tara:strand:+ start:2177 stop:2365 length:189 start_codon:yes stop_codon:yes gene_type:complete
MEELLDMMVADESPSQISDKIKDLLFSKSAEKIDAARPQVAMNMFNQVNQEEPDTSDENEEE